MSIKRMLIDAAYPEETRVSVIDGDRLLDYDVEVASRRQLKGNIYLAKVTRVEPSLQAAFVDYGGNRHGFLAFNEIHPDYYQIPVADREALLAEQKAAEVDGEDDHASEDGAGAATDEDDGEARRPRMLPRHYKIQEVIKRRQIMLVQVVKEERGTKGAALTTYLSIAGRYCVLMPNTIRGGGISRKITSAADRKRLKQIVSDLEVPEGMAVILRTAGSERSKAEIRRDYDYLLRLWNNIRELTLSSMAPTLVYEEGNLIKRSIRDLYDREIEEIVIEGEAAYRTCKDFMKLFTPSHAKRVKVYEDGNVPLFQRYGVENQLEAMLKPTVQLRSGGSIVINPTEALVSIDVNSGRATRERHIEETALRTNLEACDEIARQLRLRDLAGLIVIDFIDMEVGRNQSQVERRLREAMKNDRARVQFGKISPFGLLELSRQRLRPSLVETNFSQCPQCSGTGLIRTTESTALTVLRRIEQECVDHHTAALTVSVLPDVALYLLNQKRRTLVEMESRYEAVVTILSRLDAVEPAFETARRVDADEEAEAVVERRDEEAEAADKVGDDDGRRSRRRRSRRRRPEDEAADTEAAAVDETALADADADSDSDAAADDDADTDQEAVETQGEADEREADEREADDRQDDTDDDGRSGRKRRRRGKRGGRRRSRRGEDETDATADSVEAAEAGEEAASDEAPASSRETGARASSRRRRRRQPGRMAASTRSSVDRQDAAGFIAYDEPDPDSLDPNVFAAPVPERPLRTPRPEPVPVDRASPAAGETGEPAPAFMATDEPDPQVIGRVPPAGRVAAGEPEHLLPPAAAANAPAGTPAAGEPGEPGEPGETGETGEPAAADGGFLAPDEPDPQVVAGPGGRRPVATDRDRQGGPVGDNGAGSGRDLVDAAPQVDRQRAAEEARRTLVVNVGKEESARDQPAGAQRRGWWQRFLG